jgi:hypothetical protein
MPYYHSLPLKLSGRHTIIVDFRPMVEGTCRRVFFMNGAQARLLMRTAAISMDWMPLDHIVEVTAQNPVARFDVSGSEEWIVVTKGLSGPPPMVAIDIGEGPDGETSRKPCLGIANDAADEGSETA